MSTATVSLPDLLTAEEYALRPHAEYPDELVRGKVIPMTVPNRRHGQICADDQSPGLFLASHDLGHVLSNDAGVITHRNPDTVRGPDVAFYSYNRLPKGPLPPSYGPEVPKLVFEVRSPAIAGSICSPRLPSTSNAGVLAVVVLDEESQTALLQLPDAMPRRLSSDENLSFPGILPGFSVSVHQFF